MCATLGTDYSWIVLPLLVGLALIVYTATRFGVLPAVRVAIKASPARWDDVLVDRRVLNRLSLFGPALIFRLGLECAADAQLQDALIKVANTILIFGAVWAAGAVSKALDDLYRTLDIARSRPIKAYLQLLLVALWIFAIVLVVAMVFDQQVGRLLAGVGAFTVVLLLIFKDTILSMVASIQLINNNLLAIGDEIDVPSLELNGVVEDIALHAVTIRGPDKKTTTVPTHYLSTHVFKNWKGVDEAGGRHMRRLVFIDVSSIRFLTPEEVERFRSFEPLAEYMESKLAEIEEWNVNNYIPADKTGDPRQLTNIGTFRAYLLEYLRRQPTTATDHLAVMVRQLHPTPHGLPIEIYVYSLSTDLFSHEEVAADLLDHTLAVVPNFGLRVHQEPSTEDVRSKPDDGKAVASE